MKAFVLDLYCKICCWFLLDI